MRAADQIEIAAESADQAEIAAFFAASEGYMAALYPAESNHFVDVATLMKPNVHFLVARRAGVPVGCGAVVRATDGAAEIKRMWVDPAHRGARIGQRLLAALVRAARLDGTTVLQLETGIAQSQAIALYRAAGFVECCPFGGYAADPLSLFMELRLSR